MSDDAHELTTEDLIFEAPDENSGSTPAKLPAARTGVSVSAASPGRSAAPAPRPRVISSLSRPIKERTRARPPERVEESSTSLGSKAAAFFEEALEAERAGDKAAAIRHVKLAITFNPREIRYRELLEKLGR